MHIFNHLIGKTIQSIKRRDNDDNYAPLWPVAIHLITDKQENDLGLYIGVLNDGCSTDIAVIDSDDLWERNGGEFPEGTFIHEPTQDDALTKIIGNTITKIRLAKFNATEIKGEAFYIVQGAYAGIEILTDKNKLTFYNDYGGQLSINQDIQIPVSENWVWEE